MACCLALARDCRQRRAHSKPLRLRQSRSLVPRAAHNLLTSKAPTIAETSQIVDPHFTPWDTACWRSRQPGQSAAKASRVRTSVTDGSERYEPAVTRVVHGFTSGRLPEFNLPSRCCPECCPTRYGCCPL